MTALQPVANRPILLHALDAMQAAGVEDVAVIVPERLETRIAACVAGSAPIGLRVRYLARACEAADETALRAAAEYVGDDQCVLHDLRGLLTDPLAALAESRARNDADLLVLIYSGARGPRRLDAAARRVLRVEETDPGRTALGLVGLCFFGPGAFVGACAARAGEPGELDLTAIAERVTSRGGGLRVQAVRGWCTYAGEVADLLGLNRAMLDALAVDGVVPSGGENRIEGRVSIHATAQVTASVIVGPVIVGPGAHVTDAYIGPYTSIGADAQIEGAEVERSIISPGASIKHLGARVVGSVVGSNARIFRDFSLPRAIRLSVGEDVEVALS